MTTQKPTFRITLIGFSSLAVAMGIGRFAFTPLLPMMQEEGLASISDGGILASVHFLGYWLGAVFATKLPFSPKRTLQFSLISIGACTLGMGMTDNFSIWLALRWISGVCSAFTLILVGNYYINYLASIGRADRQGWVFSGVGAGITLAGLAALIIMESEIGSAASWQLFGILSLVVVCCIFVKIGSEIPDFRAKQITPEHARSPLIWTLIIAYGAAGVGYSIPATYLPVMARESVQSAAVFGWSWPIFGLAALLSTLVAARLQARFSNRSIWAASQIVLAAGVLMPALHSHIAMITLAGICVGGTFMIITMSGIKEVHRLVPPQDALRHIAVMTAAFATGQAIGPVFASALYELTKSFSISLILASATLLLTAVIMVVGGSKKKIPYE